jgi:hypothetical protein
MNPNFASRRNRGLLPLSHVPPKTFTLEDAQRALPLVQKIALDIHHAVTEIAAIPGGLEIIYGNARLEDFNEPSRSQIFTLNEQIADLADEISEIGAELKGLRPVLVDFLALRDQAPIYLCWAYGEHKIMHWHSLDGGFKGRQPL